MVLVMVIMVAVSFLFMTELGFKVHLLPWALIKSISASIGLVNYKGYNYFFDKEGEASKRLRKTPEKKQKTK